jgi:hypothetical protein
MKKTILMVFATLFSTAIISSCSKSYVGVPNETGAGEAKVAALDVKQVILPQFEDPYNYGRVKPAHPSPGAPILWPRQFHQASVNVVQGTTAKEYTVFITKDNLTPPLRPVFVINPFPGATCSNEYKAHIRKLVGFNSSFRGKVTGAETWSYHSNVAQTEAATPVATLQGSQTASLIHHPMAELSHPKTDDIFTLTFKSTADSPSKNEICIDQLIQKSRWGHVKDYTKSMEVFSITFEMEQ